MPNHAVGVDRHMSLPVASRLPVAFAKSVPRPANPSCLVVNRVGSASCAKCIIAPDEHNGVSNSTSTVHAMCVRLSIAVDDQPLESFCLFHVSRQVQSHTASPGLAGSSRLPLLALNTPNVYASAFHSQRQSALRRPLSPPLAISHPASDFRICRKSRQYLYKGSFVLRACRNICISGSKARIVASVMYQDMAECWDMTIPTNALALEFPVFSHTHTATRISSNATDSCHVRR